MKQDRSVNRAWTNFLVVSVVATLTCATGCATRKEKLLPQIGRASVSASIAGELKKIVADPTASEGARYEAVKAIDEIEFKVEFRRRLLPAVDSWIKANGGG